MKQDCIYADKCDVARLSNCCNATIICHDICADCREHYSDSCEECEDYITEEEDLQNRKDNLAESIYETNKSEL